METIIKKDSNGNELSLEILDGKIRICIKDYEIGMAVDLDSNDKDNLKRALDDMSERI